MNHPLTTQDRFEAARAANRKLPVDDWMALCQKVIDHLGLEKGLDTTGGV